MYTTSKQTYAVKKKEDEQKAADSGSHHSLGVKRIRSEVAAHSLLLRGSKETAPFYSSHRSQLRPRDGVNSWPLVSRKLHARKS